MSECIGSFDQGRDAVRLSRGTEILERLLTTAKRWQGTRAPNQPTTHDQRRFVNDAFYSATKS